MADIEVTGDALLDLRRCVAHLREALSQSGKTNTSQLDIARLLNETGNVALAYECYPRALGVLVGDGTGQALPPLPESAYPPDAKPLPAGVDTSDGGQRDA